MNPEPNGLICPICNLTHHRSDHNPADLLPCGGFSFDRWMSRLKTMHARYWAEKREAMAKQLNPR